MHNVFMFVQMHTGRKKKSAAAKLAERKRRDSECGSEVGSTVSLQRIESVDQDSSKANTAADKSDKPRRNNSTDSIKREVKNQDIKREVKNQDIKREVKNEDEDLGSVGKVNGVEDRSVNKDIPPKPKPRRSSRIRNNERKSVTASEESSETTGTVVSIYDKPERSITRSKKDSSPSRSSVKSDSSVKNESFSSKSKGLDIKSDPLSSLFGPPKPRLGLSPLGDLPPLDGASSLSAKTADKEYSPHEHMDIDDDSDNESKQKSDKNSDIIDKNAPSDATVHRFRAMRMTPDRSKSEESLKNAVFSPKPPTTPRSSRKNFTKGEKRNRESNSSGEDLDSGPKKTNSDSKDSDIFVNTSLSNLQAVDSEKMDVDENPAKPQKGLKMHPDVKEVKDVAELNVNQNTCMELDGAEANVNKKGAPPDDSRRPPDIQPHHLTPDTLTPESVESDGKGSGKSAGKKKGGKKNKVKPTVTSLDGGNVHSPGKGTLGTGTYGSASDLKAISENYEKALQGSPENQGHFPKASSSGVAKDSVIPEPDPNANKLAPISPKNQPPPLDQDVKSASLRTTYKTDPSYAMTKFFGRSFSGSTERDRAKVGDLSHRSLLGGSGLSALPTREARDRSVYK